MLLCWRYPQAVLESQLRFCEDDIQEVCNKYFSPKPPTKAEQIYNTRWLRYLNSKAIRKPQNGWYIMLDAVQIRSFRLQGQSTMQLKITRKMNRMRKRTVSIFGQAGLKQSKLTSGSCLTILTETNSSRVFSVLTIRELNVASIQHFLER